MKVNAFSTVFLLSLASPFVDARSCEITGSGTKPCRWYPSANSRNHANLNAGSSYSFSCWAKGELVSGNG